MNEQSDNPYSECAKYLQDITSQLQLNIANLKEKYLDNAVHRIILWGTQFELQLTRIEMDYGGEYHVRRTDDLLLAVFNDGDIEEHMDLFIGDSHIRQISCSPKSLAHFVPDSFLPLAATQFHNIFLKSHFLGESCYIITAVVGDWRSTMYRPWKLDLDDLHMLIGASGLVFKVNKEEAYSEIPRHLEIWWYQKDLTMDSFVSLPPFKLPDVNHPKKCNR